MKCWGMTPIVNAMPLSFLHRTDEYPIRDKERCAFVLQADAQDIAITKQQVEAAQILGIGFIDHIIVAKQGHLLFKERGLL